MTVTPNTESVVNPPQTPPSLVRRWLVPLLKFSFAVGLIYYVLSHNLIDFKRLQKLLETPRMLFLAMAVVSTQMFIGAQRLRLLLKTQGVQLGYFTMLRLTYIGAGFDSFLFTSVGGDAVKAVYLARLVPTGRRMEAVSVLLMDRLMGLIGMLSVTLIMALWQLEMLWSDADIRPYILAMIGVSLFFLLGLAGLLSENIHAWFSGQSWFKRLPLSSFVDRSYGALQQFRNHPKALLSAWVLSLMVHFMGVLTGYVLMLGLELNAPMGMFFVAWLMASFINSFLPLGGIGGGQVAYNLVFRRIAGLSGGADLATAFQITAALAKAPGLIIWLISREHTPAAPPAEERNV